MPSPQTELLGIKVRELRYQRGMTQAQLAGRAGVGEKTLKRLELGKTETPHPETVAAVAGALGLRPEELFEAAGAFDQAGPSPMPALHQLPRPPRNFTGREQELTELLGEVTTAGAAVVSIHGMGGIGKTALALVAAERLSDQFPDGQFYLDLRGASDPTPSVEAMLHVIRSMEPQRRQPTTDAEVEAAFRTILRSKRCLLLMDNAASREQVAPLMPPEGSLLLLTSRLRFALPGEWACALTPLPKGESRALIRSLAPHAEQVFDRLATACGGLPLALSLAGRALAERTDLDPHEYATRLADDQGRLQQLDAAERAGGVEASFALSYEMLPEEHRAGLCALAVCTQHFDRAAAAAIWDLPEPAADARIGTLVRFNLIEASGAGHAARYRLHDLVRLFATGRLQEAQRVTAAKRHAAHYMEILRKAERDATALRGGRVLRSLKLIDQEWGHIQAGYSFSCERASSDPESASLCRAAPEASTLLRLRLPPDRRIAWNATALELMNEEQSDPREASYLVDTARAYQDLGDPRRAIEHAKRGLSLAREHGEGRIEAAALLALADAYHAVGAPTEAIEHAERGLAIAREHNDRSEEAMALVMLGWGYRVLGELDLASECCERALPITRELNDRAAEGMALLALAFARRRHQDRGRTSASQCLQIAREMGDRRIEGYALIAMGEGEAGEQSYDESLAIARAIGERRMEGHALLATGVSLMQRDEPQAAVLRLEASLDIAHETGDRAMEANALVVLGMANATLRNFPRAIEVLARDEELAIEMGNRHLAALAAWFLSLAYERHGDLKGALAAAERTAEHAVNAEWPGVEDMHERIASLQAALKRG